MLQNQFINYHFVIEQKSEGRITQKDQQLQWQCAHDLHWRAMRLGAPNIWVCVVYTRICVNLSFNHFLQNLHSPGLFDIKITNWIEFLCYTSFSGDLKLRYQIIFDRIDIISFFVTPVSFDVVDISSRLSLSLTFPLDLIASASL